MATARVFKSGNSQAVRLPKEFQFKGKEVEIFRRGDEVVLREKARTMQRAFELLATFPSISMPSRRRERSRRNLARGCDAGSFPT
jgi:antitoxin VapB